MEHLPAPGHIDLERVFPYGMARDYDRIFPEGVIETLCGPQPIWDQATNPKPNPNWTLADLGPERADGGPSPFA